MIGQLPVSLQAGEKQWAIRSDYRVALTIFQAFAEPDYTDVEKQIIMLSCLYRDFDEMPQELYQEAAERAAWFLDGGKQRRNTKEQRRTMDWEQDEPILFPAINKVAGREVRELEYLHWWTFLGYFNEIGEGLFSNVLSIRLKKAKGQHLEKYEEEFYRENKEMIDLKPRYTKEEREEIERLKELLGE